MLRRGTTLFATFDQNAGLIGTTLPESDGFARFAAEQTALTSLFSGSTYSKNSTIESIYATALPADGLGDFHPLPNASLIATGDEAGGGKGLAPGNPVLTVDAAHTIGTINTIGDQDFYQVTLVAGQTYQIGMYGYSGGPNGVPNPDSYVEVYGADGTTLLASGDGGANTPANQVNSGFDVLMTFTAPTSGTYYIDARAFDQNATNGTTGDSVGDYELFVHNATNDPNVYHPYYTDDSPLYAIDWGTRVNKVDQTAANPDGNEGPRPTGNAQGTPTYGSALNMDAILAANGKTWADIAGKNVITIYFAKAGEVVTSLEDPANPGLPPVAVQTSDVSDFEHLAVMTALHQFELVADVVYLEVQSKDQADFEYASYKGTPGPGISLLGSMEPPDEPNEGLALFNSGDYRWNATDLQQGGFSFVTLIHEIGHGHGLAHPHDNGGHSGIMHGVQPEGAGVADYTTGDFHLNQSVFTMMSYEDGWQDSPYGNAPTTGGYGYLGGLMAFDIAAIQDKYGVNEDTATGNDVYLIKDVNAPGTYYTSIWDAGGTDEIKYVGARDTTIDLRAATLKYEWGGGGNVSFAYGIFGGFTIANGVVIENATSDGGNDTLVGNEVANKLSSGAGNDTLTGNGGDDILDGGTGADQMAGGTGNDIYYVDDTGDTVLENAGEGSDEVRTTVGAYTLAANVENLTYVGTGNFTGTGNGLDNVITGGAGNDLFMLQGGGNDNASGLGGSDAFYYGGALTSADSNDGGAGRDVVILQGDYSAGVTLGAHALDTVEALSVQSGSVTRWGDTANNHYSYDITSVDSNVAAGTQLIVNGQSLLAGEDFTFNGSAETDGTFLIYGGAGTDHLTGGAGGDIFNFEGGRWNATDMVDGGAGRDVVIISGVVNGMNNIVIGAGQLTNIEALSFSSRYAATPASTPSYNVTLNDGNVTPGGTLIVNASSLTNPAQTFALDAHTVTGNLWILGGSSTDTIVAGSGNDIVYGGLGQDELTGGAGADTFQFKTLQDSSNGAADHILDFTSGTDKVDLGAIDADTNQTGDQAFTFIGANAFDHQAGELRAEFDQANDVWTVQGDVDGDGQADFTIHVTTAGNQPILQGDFIA